MDDTAAVLGIMAAYLGVVLLLGVLAGRGRDRSVEEFVAGSRSFGFVVMYFLLGGAIFSAFAYLGGPGWAYSKGAASFYLLGYSAAGLLPWWLFGPRAQRVGKRFGYVTQAQLFAHRFESRGLSLVVATVSLLAFVQYITVQMKGCAYVFEVASGGRIPFWAGALIAYAVVVGYTFFGGVRGVAWTNVFQGAFMIATAWVLGLYFVYTLYDGPADMFRKIAAARPTHLLVGPRTAMGYGEYTSALLVSVLGFSMWPHLFMKAYAAKSERVLKRTIVMYPTFAVFLVPVLFIGFAGVMQVPPQTLGAPDRILPYMFTHMDFPAVAVGFVLAAALAAAMSTQDTVSHAAGCIFAQDIVAPLLGTDSDPRAAARWARLSVVGFGAAAYTTAVVGGQTLVQLLLGAYGSIVQLLPVCAATFLWPRATRPGVTWGLLVGVGTNYAVMLEVLPNPWGLHAGLVGLGLNVLVLVVVSLLTKAMPAAHIRRFVLS